MRLLDVISGEFVEFSDARNIPPYAILSHRWTAGEQIYQDVKRIQEESERDRALSIASLGSLMAVLNCQVVLSFLCKST